MATQKTLRRDRIKRGIRNKITGTAERPRLTVFRSNKGIEAQIINDEAGVTLGSFSSLKLDTNAPKVEISKSVGAEIAKIALEKGISSVVFDRNGYLYHGRVKALAEGAREGGLKF